MNWNTEDKDSTISPKASELKTLERALEYGGEGGSLVIVRTHLEGQTRYWQLARDYTWVDDDPVASGRRLEFLGSDAEQALRTSKYPWWLLVGLYVAPDLRPVVAKILAEENRTLQSWLSSGDWNESNLEDLSEFRS